LLSDCYIDLYTSELIRISIGTKASIEDIANMKKDWVRKEKERNTPIEKQKFDIRELEKIPFMNIVRKGKKK